MNQTVLTHIRIGVFSHRSMESPEQVGKGPQMRGPLALRGQESVLSSPDLRSTQNRWKKWKPSMASRVRPQLGRTLCRGQGALRSPAGKIQVSAGMAFSKLRERCVRPLRWEWRLLPYQHSVWRRDRLGDRRSYLSRDALLTPKAGQRRARLHPIPRAGWVPAAQKNL